MEVETPMNKSSESVENIRILVVDDDATCLSIVAMILTKCNYQVVTVKHPMDALSTLWIKGDSFDLVVTDVHKPDMNGFELQQVITQEFELPVVLMSADDKEGTILKGLKGVSVDDLRGQWQYAVLQEKKGKRAVLEDIESLEKSSNCYKKSVHEVWESASSVDENCYQHIKKETSKRKSAIKQGNAHKDNSVNSVVPTKTKVLWTESLHNKFLEAIRNIGFDKAVPSKILDHMKVPGLTRENVASRLQKYRIFLRRVTDASCRIQAPDINLASRADQSTISYGTLGKYSRFHQENFAVQSSIPSSSIHTSTRYLTGNLQHLKNKGKEVDAVLDPVRNFSVFHNVNATQESQGIGDLSTSFMNQGNVQPHQQNNEDEMTVNFDGDFNLDTEKEDYFQ